MKKLFVALMLFATPAVHAVGLGDLVKGSLLDHVELQTLYRLDEGDSEPYKLAMLDSFLRLGKYKGASFLDIQGGFLGNTTGTDENEAVNWVGGLQFKVDPFLRGRLPFPEHWKFLNSIKHGPSIHRDFTNDQWIFRYGVGLSFGLEPVTD